MASAPEVEEHPLRKNSGETHPSPPPPPASDRIKPANSPASPHWHDLVAGAAAGLGARAITAPLDLLKIRRQLVSPSDATVSSSFVGGEWRIFHQLRAIAEKEGGVRSLYRGNVAASCLWMGYSVAQFCVYGYASEHLRDRCALMNEGCGDGESLEVASAISFASGATSGLVATAVTYPFDLCRTIFAARGVSSPVAASNITWSDSTTNLVVSKGQNEYYSQVQYERRPPKTLGEFARHMHQKKGLRGFYAGSAPGLLQIVPYMGINFALHDLMVTLANSSDSRVSGIAGMGAGVISKFLVYPLDTVKKRLQAQAFWGGSGANTGSTNARYSVALPTGSSVYYKKRKKPGAVDSASGRQSPVTARKGIVHYDGMIDCFRQIARREGVAAFYKGLTPSLVKSSVSTGASFWLFTWTKNILQSVHDPRAAE